MALSPEKLQLLRAAYLDGSTMREAAGAAKVSPQTAWRKFRAFRAEGLARPVRPPSPSVARALRHAAGRPSRRVRFAGWS